MSWRAITASFLAATAMLSAGCLQHEERTPDGRIIIDYWEKWQGFEKDAMAVIVDKYNASQNEVFVRYISQSQIDRKLLLSAAGGNPPDVAGFWSHTVVSYAEKGALIPLDRLMKRDGIRKEDYVDSIIEECQYRGFVWGLPSTPATIALHYNKQLFREAGLDPERPPQTVKELAEFSRKLTKRDEEGKIIQLGFSPSDPGWWSPMWSFFFGGSMVSDDMRTLTLMTPANIFAFQWLSDFADEYGRSDLRRFEAASGQFASSDNSFISGRLAMQLQGVWMSNFIDQFNPDLDWGAAAFPACEFSGEGATIVECDMLVIPKGASHIEEAWDFIKFVQQQENMEELCMGHRKFTPLKEVSGEFYAGHPNREIELFRALAESPNAKGVPKMPVWDFLRAEMGPAFEECWVRDTPAEQALRKVEQRVQPRLDQAMESWDRVAEERLKTWSEL